MHDMMNNNNFGLLLSFTTSASTQKR